MIIEITEQPTAVQSPPPSSKISSRGLLRADTCGQVPHPAKLFRNVTAIPTRSRPLCSSRQSQWADRLIGALRNRRIAARESEERAAVLHRIIIAPNYLNRIRKLVDLDGDGDIVNTTGGGGEDGEGSGLISSLVCSWIA
jgi:hypothetical protein